MTLDLQPGAHSYPQNRSPRRPVAMLNVATQLLMACVVGLSLGVLSILRSPLWALALLGVVCFVAVVKYRPALGLLCIVVATSSIIFEARLPLVQIGVGSLHVVDGILLLLLYGVILSRLAGRAARNARTALDLPVLAFYAVCLLATFVGIGQGTVTSVAALRELRVFSYYLTFFVVTHLVRDERQLGLLLKGLMFIAVVVAATMLAQYVLGTGINLFPGRVETLITQNVDYTGVTRVLPPGQSLVLVAFLALIIGNIVGIQHGFSISRVVWLVLLGLAVILTFNRSFWIAVAVALALLALLAPGETRRRLAHWVLAAAFLMLVVMVPVFSAPHSGAARLVGAFTQRMATLTSSSPFQDSSFRWRFPEYEYAVAQIMAHPILGLGLGARYRPYDPRLDWSGFDLGNYIHNGHLWVILDTGLVGYGCLVWMSALFIWRGLKGWRSVPDARKGAVVLAFVLTYSGGCVAAIVDPIFAQWYWTPLVGIMMGTNEVILMSSSGTRPLNAGR